MARYQLKDALFEDIFSTLYEARDSQTDSPVLVWAYHGKFGTPSVLAQLSQIGMKLSGVKHPHVLPLLDYYTGEDRSFYAVYAYEKLTPLDEFLQAEKNADSLQKWQWVTQVLSAMKALEAGGVLWGGLNLGHVMVDARGQIRLTKAGFPLIFYRAFAHRMPVVDDAEFLPPEFIRSRYYTIQSDIYAFGVLVTVMMSGKWPHFRWNTWRALRWRTRFPVRSFSKELTPRVKWLVSWCLCSDPNSRFPSFDDLLKHYETADYHSLPTQNGFSGLLAFFQMGNANFRRWVHRWKWGVGGLLIIIFVVLGIKWEMDRASSGTETVVPNVVGLPAQEAMQQLAALHLRGDVVDYRYDFRYPAGVVIECKPPVGREVRFDRPVHLILSKGKGPWPVPHVIGKPVTDIYARFGSMVSINVVQEVFSYEIPKGTIMSQTPSPSAILAPNRSFDLVISGGFPATIGVESIQNNMASVTVYVGILPDGPDQSIRIVAKLPTGAESVLKEVSLPPDARETFHFQLPVGSEVMVYYSGKLAIQDRITP
jgi:hypothetical protein